MTCHFANSADFCPWPFFSLVTWLEWRTPFLGGQQAVALQRAMRSMWIQTLTLTRDMENERLHRYVLLRKEFLERWPGAVE